MRGVFLEVPEWLVEQRAESGADRRDEVWDGVLHMVPEPTIFHTDFEYELRRALHPIVERLGLRTHQQVAIRDPSKGWKNYRKPDLIVSRPANESDAAVDGPAELVVEVLSPNDESRDKFPFYASRGVREIWLIHPKTRELEVFTLVGGGYEIVPVIDGVTRAPALGIELAVIDQRLHIRDGEYVADV